MSTIVADAIIINLDKQLLLVEKNQKRILPGGKIDSNETDIGALLRELDEELTLSQKDVVLGDEYKDFAGITPTSKKDILVKTWFCGLNGEITPKAEITQAKYFDYQTMKLIDCSDITRQIVEALKMDNYL